MKTIPRTDGNPNGCSSAINLLRTDGRRGEESVRLGRLGYNPQDSAHGILNIPNSNSAFLKNDLNVRNFLEKVFLIIDPCWNNFSSKGELADAP